MDPNPPAQPDSAGDGPKPGDCTGANEPAATTDGPITSDVVDWVDRYGDDLFRFALAKTGDRSLAEDLVQDTFLSVVKSNKSFRRESSVSTWLFAILKHKVIDHYRRNGRRTRIASSQPLDDSGLENPPPPSTAGVPSRHWGGDPAKICESREFWGAFDTCVEKLPNKLAEVFILREINQRSPQEIRELLGISATNLSMRLHRCRLAMRDCLSKNWFQDKA